MSFFNLEGMIMGNNKFCTNCGTSIKINDKFCTNCGKKLENINQKNYEKIIENRQYVKKNPWIALLLSSLIVGLGQFYNNDYKKGFYLLTAAIIGSVFTAGGMWFAAAIYSMMDAFIDAKKINKKVK